MTMNILIKYVSWPVIIWCLFFSTIWRFCVLILSPLRISFATPTKIVSMFLTIQFHPSTACLIVVARLSVWRFYFLEFFGFYSFRLSESLSWKPDSCVCTVSRLIFWTPYRPDTKFFFPIILRKLNKSDS